MRRVPGLGWALAVMVLAAAGLSMGWEAVGISPSKGEPWSWITSGPFVLPPGLSTLETSALSAVAVGIVAGVALGLWLRGRRGPVARLVRFLGAASFAVPFFLLAPLLIGSTLPPDVTAWATGAVWSPPIAFAVAFRLGDRPPTWSRGAVLAAEGRRVVRLLGEDLPVMAGGWMAASLHGVSPLALWHLLLLAAVLSGLLMTLGRPGEATRAQRRVKATEMVEVRRRPSAL